MTLPKPHPAEAVDLDAIIAKTMADEQVWTNRAAAVQGQAAQALARLLNIAEESDTGQARRVANFIAASFNGRAYTFDLFDLRALDVTISDDVLVCMDALRWAKTDLFNLVPDGYKRIERVIHAWGIDPKDA